MAGPNRPAPEHDKVVSVGRADRSATRAGRDRAPVDKQANYPGLSIPTPPLFALLRYQSQAYIHVNEEGDGRDANYLCHNRVYM